MYKSCSQSSTSYNYCKNNIPCSKSIKISQLKSQLVQLEEDDKAYNELLQKYRQLQNDYHLMNEARLHLEYEIKQKDEKNILKSFGDNSEIKDLKEPLYLIILNAFYKYFLLKQDAKIESNENPRVKFGEIKFQFSERFFSELLKFIAEYLNYIMDI